MFPSAAIFGGLSVYASVCVPLLCNCARCPLPSDYVCGLSLTLGGVLKLLINLGESSPGSSSSGLSVI